jgi:hypothetical protein
MNSYSMPGDLFQRIRKPGWTIIDTIDHIREGSGLQYQKFDETHVHFDVTDSKKLVLFLLKEGI